VEFVVKNNITHDAVQHQNSKFHQSESWNKQNMQYI